MRTHPLRAETDADIVQRVLDGDVNAFSVLLERYQELVLRIVKKHVPYGQVEETAQDVFIRAFQSLKGLRETDRFKQWLSSIAVRTCYDFWRRHYRNRETPQSQLSDEHRNFLDLALADASSSQWSELGKRAEAREILDWALDRLSPQDRMVLELIYLEGYSGKETAALLGWSVANVKVRAFRSRKKLEKLLHEQGSAP